MSIICKMKNIGITGNYFSLWLSLIAFIIWLLSIERAMSDLYVKGIGDLGIITILPVTYIIAIILLTVSFFISLRSEKKNEKLITFQVVLLVFFLFSVTPLIGDGSRLSYLNYGFTDYIIRNGHINQQDVLYHNWPSYFLYYAVVRDISGIGQEYVLRSFPIFPNILFLPALLMFFGFVFKGVANGIEKKWLCIWMFYIANWIYQDSLNAQSMAFFIFILISTILIKLMDINSSCVKYKKPFYGFMLILFIFSIITGHALTSLAISSIIFSVFVFNYYRNRYIVFGTIIAVASWNIYHAVTFFNNNFSEYLSRSLEFESVLQRGIVTRTTGSYDHSIVASISIIFTLLLVVFALIGTLSSVRYFKDIDKRILFMFSVPLIIISVYGHEGPMRAYLFSMLGLLYFISKNTDHRRMYTILVIFLIFIAPVLHIVSYYGNEKWLLISSGNTNGKDFFYSNIHQGYVLGGEELGFSNGAYDNYKAKLYRKSQSQEQFNVNDFDNSTRWIERFQRLKDKDWPLYVSINNGMKVYYSLFYNEPRYFDDFQKILDQQPLYGKVYTNPDFELYVVKEIGRIQR